MNLRTEKTDSHIVAYNFPLFFISDEHEKAIAYSSLASSKDEPKSKRRVLVVDDSPDVVEMLRFLLTHAGFDVVTATSALSALGTAREQHFDAVISDIGMPAMDGFELAKSLRNLPGYESVPMIAVTGYGPVYDRPDAYAAGFTDYMTKPIDFGSLLLKLKHL